MTRSAPWLTGGVSLAFALAPLARQGDLASLSGAAGAAALVTQLALGLRRADRAQAALRREREELNSLIDLDPLTGLMNRSAFHLALDRIGAVDADLIATVFFDLDKFKEINDALGHKAGDELLVQVAARARTALPGAFAIARLGGDEFGAILPCRIDERSDACGRALLEALAPPMRIGRKDVSVGASIGIAIGDPTAIDGVELLRRADIAMYAAKIATGEKFRLFDDALDHHEVLQSSVRAEVGKAMIEDMFALHYQPIVDARCGTLESVEALLRPQSEGLRNVSPASLIATAEASGQIIELTDWTLGAAMEVARALGNTPVALNISPVYFRRPEFVHTVFDRLLSTGTRPDMIILEVTEGVLIERLDAAQQSLARLREVGMKVHLDDFGTGYSSLSYLQHFDLDGLKLDKSFLRAIGDKRKANQIIRSMVDFGHSLDLKVIVEGVESEWQARLMQLLGCDLLQGYGIAMPMPIDDLLAFREARRGEAWLADNLDQPISLAAEG